MTTKFKKTLLPLMGLSQLAVATPTLIEAESMTKSGFQSVDNSASSGGQFAKLTATSGNLTYTYTGASALVDLSVTYLDETDGACNYYVFVNGAQVGSWHTDQMLDDPGISIDNRVTTIIEDVSINTGNQIKLIVNRAGGAEFGRVDHISITGKVEAETMTKSGYYNVTHSSASGNALVQTNGTGTLTHTFDGANGHYSINTHYYDETDGVSQYQLSVNGDRVDSWVADERLGSAAISPLSLTSKMSDWVYLKKGDILQLEGVKNSAEFARIDRIDISPATHYTETIRASHFLSQASMGGTKAEIYALADRMEEIGYLEACEEWIDKQFATPIGSNIMDSALKHQTFIGTVPLDSINIRNFEYSWWHTMMTSEAQLRHRMAFALSQIFVTSSSFWNNSERNNIWFSYTNYYDKLVENAFSTHRNLIQDITYDPFMGVYLTYAHNSKADPNLGTFPDENYARELMQLFTIGVYALNDDGTYKLDSNGNPIENYDNDDIEDLSRVFTGLSMQNWDQTLPNWNSPPTSKAGSYLNEMRMVNNYHDTGSKRLATGAYLQGGLDGDVEISQALDQLCLSHSSTAPFICRELIKRLTSSNPSTQYINRVVKSWKGNGPYGNGVGEFKNVLKAILLDEEARKTFNFLDDPSSQSSNATKYVYSTDNISGRVKEPILKYCQMYRYMEPVSSLDGSLIIFPARTKPASNNTNPHFGQVPMRAKSVFNFYDTEYSPGNGPIASVVSSQGIDFVSPEMEILSEHIIHDYDEFHDFVKDAKTGDYLRSLGVNSETKFTWLEDQANRGISLRQFVDDVNRDLCNGQIRSTQRWRISHYVGKEGGTTLEQYALALSLIFSSPEFNVAY